MDVHVPGVPAERFCINQLAGTGLLLMQHVALALQNPAPAPRAARHVLAASLKAVFGKKCWLLPAQHPAPHSGCSRAPPSVAPARSAQWAALCVGSAPGGFAPGKSVLQKPRGCCRVDVSGNAGINHLSGTNKTPHIYGSGQQFLEFSALVQNLQLFQCLHLREALSSPLPQGLG